jgi:hypothetical protein
MTFEYDDKGKFFTDVISKTPVLSLVQTTTHLIRGNIHIRTDERVKDELDRDKKFLAITDATISDANGKMLHEKKFVAIQKKQIVWVIPNDENSGSENEG